MNRLLDFLHRLFVTGRLSEDELVELLVEMRRDRVISQSVFEKLTVVDPHGRVLYGG